MIFSYGSRLTSKSKSYKKESAPSTTNSLKSTVSFVSGSNIDSSNKNKPVVKNEAVAAKPLRLRRTDVAVAASTRNLPLFEGPNEPPNGLMTPNAIRLASVSSLPSERCSENEHTHTHPLYPCYECYKGRWLHMDDILPDELKGCYEHFEDETGDCVRNPIFPNLSENCERCIAGQVYSICESCETCSNTWCVDDCPEGEVCYSGKCAKQCGPDKPNACNYMNCEKCDDSDTKACISFCSPVEVCNGYGKCISPCVPACTGCDECVFRDGVYGCESREKSNCHTNSVCCKGKIYHLNTGCQSIDEDCNFIFNCPGDLCERNQRGCNFCATGCTNNSDCDASKCETCEVLGWDGYKGCISCVAGGFCNGNGDCLELSCNGCQELRLKAECDETESPILTDCMECVDICNELTGPDGKPLTCAPDISNPARVFCQYQPPVIIASIIP